MQEGEHVTGLSAIHYFPVTWPPPEGHPPPLLSFLSSVLSPKLQASDKRTCHVATDSLGLPGPAIGTFTCPYSGLFHKKDSNPEHERVPMPCVEDGGLRGRSAEAQNVSVHGASPPGLRKELAMLCVLNCRAVIPGTAPVPRGLPWHAQTL